jgi:hypothetical protein
LHVFKVLEVFECVEHLVRGKHELLKDEEALGSMMPQPAPPRAVEGRHLPRPRIGHA